MKTKIEDINRNIYDIKKEKRRNCIKRTAKIK